VIAATPPPPSPRTAIVLAERIVQHNPSWKPTSVYCEPGGTTRRCQWVAQGNLLLPDELVTVTAVYGPGRAYRFTLVATTYKPSGRRASCRIEPARGGYRASCRKV
jgi:hypothetical protein